MMLSPFSIVLVVVGFALLYLFLAGCTFGVLHYHVECHEEDSVWGAAFWPVVLVFGILYGAGASGCWLARQCAAIFIRDPLPRATVRKADDHGR